MNLVSTVAIVGNVNIDLIIRPVVDLPSPGTERIVDRIEMRVGGAAATAALTLAKLGHTPRIASCVGDDVLGRWLQGELTRGGVVPEVPVVEGTASAVSVGFEAPASDRSFLTDLGNLCSFDVAMVPEEVLASDLVLFCGYFLLPALRGAPTMELTRRAHAAGSMVLLDTGWDPAGWTHQTLTEIRSILPSVDVFLPNEVEARAIAGVDETPAAARVIQAKSGGWVVVKCGAAGCIATGPDGRELRASAPPVDVIDTIGAGDAFNAGLIHALSAGMELEEALPLAVRVGSAIVSRPSADRFPDAGEILD